MRVSQRSVLFLGVALVACATVLLEIALTRLYAAQLGHHFAFLAPSLSLLGAGLGGIFLYLAPSLARPPALFARLAALSALASGATAASVIVLLQLQPILDLEPRSLLWLALAYAVSAFPFALIGVVLAAAIQHVVLEMPRLYLVDLVGAAAGFLVSLAALRVGAPRAVLIAAVMLAASSLFFYLASQRSVAERRASGGLIATFMLGTSVLLAGDIGAPWLKLTSLRWTALDKVEFQAWSGQALVTVDRPRMGMASLRVDGLWANSIFDAKTPPPIHPDDMAYQLHRDQGPVLVVGAGGGRDVRSALKAGQKDIFAVESNRDVVNQVMRGRYADFSDRLFDKPEVHLTLDDARSYVRHTHVLFRNIVVSSTDSNVAFAAGALALSESRLLTVEALRDFLERLTPEGTLIISRSDNEFERLLALSATALRRVGADSPKAHFFACGASKSTSLLIKRTPLAQTEIDALRRHCRKNKFTEAFAPDRPLDGVRSRLVTMTDVRAAEPDPAADLTPPTADRPFFFYNVPLRKLPAALRDINALKVERAGLFALISLLGLGLVLGMLGVLGPLLVFRRRASKEPLLMDAMSSRRPGPARPLIFFSAIGAGFALVELVFAQRLVVLLGTPAQAVPVVLVILLLCVGVGGFLTTRIAPAAAVGTTTTLAQVLVGIAALVAVALDPILEFSLGFPFGGRLAVALTLLAPLGLLIGSLAPLGIKLVAASSSALIPWCWGLSAIAGLIATAVGALMAVNLGYSAVLLAAGLAYLVAAAVVPPFTAAAVGAEADAQPAAVPETALVS